MNQLQKLKQELLKLADTKRAESSTRFFKTGKGEYSEGDVFIGIRVPVLREVAKEFKDMNRKSVEKLLKNEIHEYRFIALIILTIQFNEGNKEEKKEITKFYLEHTRQINNWDLVDISAPQILGTYLLTKNKAILQKLVVSKLLWERRIAIVSSHAFIKKGIFDVTITLAEKLLNDKEDLMHKATGWMLREMGKRNKKTLVQFLDKYSKVMPRTMLRYSIEHFSQEERKHYMKK